MSWVQASGALYGLHELGFFGCRYVAAEGTHGERVAVTSVTHGKETIDNLLNVLLRKVDEGQGG